MRYQPMKYNLITAKPMNFGKFSWNQKPKKVTKKDKNLSYNQAKNRYNLTPFSDFDRDGFANMIDCKPLDFSKQGAIHDIKRAVKKKLGMEVPSRAQEQTAEIQSYKFDKSTGGYTYKPKPKQLGEKGYWKETAQEMGSGAKKVATVMSKAGLEQITRPPKEIQGKKLGAQLGEITKGAGVRNWKENARENLKIGRESNQPKVIVMPVMGTPTRSRTTTNVSGMPPQPEGWWRGTPQQPTEQRYQQLPEGMTDEEIMQYEQYMQQQAEPKLPPLITRPDGTVVRVQRYQPVTLQQSFLPYRPVTYKPFGRKVENNEY